MSQLLAEEEGVVLEVKFKAVVVSKTLLNDPVLGKGIKIEMAEERDLPPPVMISQNREGAEWARQVMPIVSQVLQAIPFARQGKATFHRVTLWLTDDEWERLEPKPDIGDEVEVVVKGGSLKFRVGEGST